MRGSKGVAMFAIADAYETKRDYAKALKQMIIIRDKYINEWAKEPVVERAIYLDYALKGEYELAIEHAQKAIEEDEKLPNVPKGGSPDYIQRLNDLKVAKDYILSLKNKK
jgi:tetratricopeptide (TPR) repeat protein